MDSTSSFSILGPKGQPPKSYVRNGIIMLFSVVVLVGVIFFLFFFHNCSKCFSLRRRRSRQRQIRLERMARQLVLPSEENQGLEICVLKSVPVFIYDSRTGDTPPECPVCLSEFEDYERGRLLPNCGHRFHNDCIDVWFRSHSNCPLCRSIVQLHIPEAAKSDIEEGGSGSDPVIESGISEAGRPICSSRRNMSAHCLRELEEVVAGKVERRAYSLTGLSSAGGPDLLDNPGNRVLSLKRIWSI